MNSKNKNQEAIKGVVIGEQKFGKAPWRKINEDNIKVVISNNNNNNNNNKSNNNNVNNKSNK